MGTKRDWRKAKHIGPTEDFRGGGVELKNGEVTAMPRRDKLGQRADRAMRDWLRRNPKVRKEFGS